jgi:uncharacterized protein YkwD
MKAIKFLLVIFLITQGSNQILGQGACYYENGIRYEIPDDWDFLENDGQRIREQEKIFIDLLNEERAKIGLSPLEFDQEMYDKISLPHAKKMAAQRNVFHSKEYRISECCTGTHYGYPAYEVARYALVMFRRSQPHWEILMRPDIEKISVGMWQSAKSYRLSGEILVCVNVRDSGPLRRRNGR